MVPLSFAGEAFLALPEAALFWPRRRALLLADLHFEKASWYAGHGQMLPPYDSMATLADVQRLAQAVEAREIWCLGDSFHDAAGVARLPPDARAALTALTGRYGWHWITGNHDAGQADALGGVLLEEAEVDGLILRHEAVAGEPRPELSGHYHPKLRLKVRGQHVARRCFVRGERKIILPAFGALTGGLDAGHPEIRSVIGPSAEALVAVGDRLLCFPIMS